MIFGAQMKQAPLIIIIPEYKKSDPAVGKKGIRLMTVHVRRGPPDVKDENWNHISKATDIQACSKISLLRTAALSPLANVPALL